MNNLIHRQQIFTLNVAHLIEYIFQHGYMCTLGECYRPTEMAQIYAKAKKGIEHSRHCERLAIDLNLFDLHDNYITDPKVYEQFGIFWEKQSKGNVWGGRFETLVDLGHFEAE